MSQQVELNEGEGVVSLLADPDQFVKHRNQVAGVTDQRLIFLKKRTLGAYYEVEYLPISDWLGLRYQKKLAVGAMIGGALLTLLGLTVVVLAARGELESIKPIIYGLGMVVVGVSLIFGVKRHNLVFECRGRTLRWISASGTFKQRKQAIELLVEFAKSRGVPVSGIEEMG